MGLGHAKPRRPTSVSTRPTTTMTPELEAIDRIRRTLRKDLDTFLLNNILLSVQFFDNFDRELATLKSSPSGQRDVERSSKLAQHHRHCLSPERLYDIAAKRVRFRTRQLLHNPRLFVVQYNVDVVEEDTEYSALHHPDAYRFNIEDSEKSGYVKLRAEDNMLSKRHDMYEDEAIYSSGSSHSEDKPRITPQEEDEIREIISELPGSNRRSKLGSPTQSLPNLAVREKRSVSSGYKSMGSSPAPLSDSSGYAYTTLRELTKPRPLAELSLGSVPREEGQIPARCFSSQVLPDYNNPGRYQTRYYLNSNTYMHCFVEEFSARLGEKLGFTEREKDMAIQQGARIVCGMEGTHTDIIPALHCPTWPENAREWYSRSRTRLPDSRPGAVHGWPSQRTLEDIHSLGCHLVPFGFAPTRGRNSEHHLEWRIAYPTAERRLECCLSHSQVRCLLFTLTLYRTFLEPLVDSDQLGLLPSHIRTLLFWQCETHPNWPEDRLGEVLRKFLDKLYDCLKRRRLPDYFIPSHNLFQGIPRPCLLIGQNKLSEVRENLVMHLLVALCNLNYINEEFYPVLDYKRLYRIITTDNLAGLLNPSLRHLQNTRTKYYDSDSQSDESEEEKIPQRDVKREWKKAAWRKEARRATNQSSEKHKPSGENINIKVQPKKGAELPRKTALLDFFIPHFINMARKSNTFRATRQAHMYLQQAERLSKLLAECEEDSASFDSKSRHYMIDIDEIRQAMGPVPSYTDPNFSLGTTAPVAKLSEISGPTKILRSNPSKLSLDIHNSKSTVPSKTQHYKQAIRTENVNNKTYVPQFEPPEPKVLATKSVSVNPVIASMSISKNISEINADIMPYDQNIDTDKLSTAKTANVLNNIMKDTPENVEVTVTIAQVHATQEPSPDTNKESKFTFEEKLEEESTDL